MTNVTGNQDWSGGLGQGGNILLDATAGIDVPARGGYVSPNYYVANVPYLYIQIRTGSTQEAEFDLLWYDNAGGTPGNELAQQAWVKAGIATTTDVIPVIAPFCSLSVINYDAADLFWFGAIGVTSSPVGSIGIDTVRGGRTLMSLPFSVTPTVPQTLVPHIHVPGRAHIWATSNVIVNVALEEFQAPTLTWVTIWQWAALFPAPGLANYDNDIVLPNNDWRIVCFSPPSGTAVGNVAVLSAH